MSALERDEKVFDAPQLLAKQVARPVKTANNDAAVYP